MRTTTGIPGDPSAEFSCDARGCPRYVLAKDGVLPRGWWWRRDSALTTGRYGPYRRVFHYCPTHKAQAIPAKPLPPIPEGPPRTPRKAAISPHVRRPGSPGANVSRALAA